MIVCCSKHGAACLISMSFEKQGRQPACILAAARQAARKRQRHGEEEDEPQRRRSHDEDGSSSSDNERGRSQPRQMSSSSSRRKRCWLCTFANCKIAKQVSAFVSTNAGTMDPAIMADQIKKEVLKEYPLAKGIGRSHILRHIREHVLIPGAYCV